MSENVTTQDKKDTKEEGLITLTFDPNGAGRRITRQVYPEVAKFITSRDEAREVMGQEQRRALRARQQYIWQKEDEFLANPNRTAGVAFDDYSAGREWDRNPENRGGAHGAERRYYDFVNARARRPEDRNDRDNPNSWAILREEAEAAGHGLVVWVVDNCLDNEHEASILVKYLPATPEELWDVAKNDHDMCRVFDGYMERAEAEGLFSENDLPNSVRQQRALMSYLRRTYGAGYIRSLLDHIRPVVKAEVEAAVASAREQWQRELLDKYAASSDMQELIRSLAESNPVIQTHLNRSEGARRAAETRRRNNEILMNLGQGASSA